jgi:hypothetical protein
MTASRLVVDDRNDLFPDELGAVADRLDAAARNSADFSRTHGGATIVALDAQAV